MIVLLEELGCRFSPLAGWFHPLSFSENIDLSFNVVGSARPSIVSSSHSGQQTEVNAAVVMVAVESILSSFSAVIVTCFSFCLRDVIPC